MWQYGKDYDYDAPVKLLDKLLHSMSQCDDEQLVVISQVILTISPCRILQIFVCSLGWLFGEGPRMTIYSVCYVLFFGLGFSINGGAS